MIRWENLDKLESFRKLKELARVSLADEMSGKKGEERVRTYSVPMAGGLEFNYAAKAVNKEMLDTLADLAKEAQLVEKYRELYNGAVINTGGSVMSFIS